jgi:hypothetical protein
VRMTEDKSFNYAFNLFANDRPIKLS